MKIFNMKRVTLSVLLVGLCFTSCVGPFNTTKQLHTWNREIENRWLGEGVFVALRFIYVYPLAIIGDMFIFNSIEFWGGTNPIDPVSPARLKALDDADDAWAAGEAEAAKPDDATE
jgi:hypothetical protein